MTISNEDREQLRQWARELAKYADAEDVDVEDMRSIGSSIIELADDYLDS